MKIVGFDKWRRATLPRRHEIQRGVSWFLEHVDYVPDTGKFYFKKQGGNKNNVPGKEIVPTKVSRHSVEIFLNGKSWQALRVAYICMEQKIPDIVLPKDGNFSNLVGSNVLHLSHEDFRELESEKTNSVRGMNFDKINFTLENIYE